MTDEIGPHPAASDRIVRRIALGIVVAGALLSGTVWIQLYRAHPDGSGIVDGFSLTLWLLALLPYLVGWFGVLTNKPGSAVAGLLVGLSLDILVRVQALNSVDAYTGLALMLWPFFATAVILISALVFSLFERRVKPASRLLGETTQLRVYNEGFQGSWVTFGCLLLVFFPAAIIYYMINRR
jgi:hypothetical protein